MYTKYQRVCADFGAHLLVLSESGNKEKILSHPPDLRPVVGDWVRLDAHNRLQEIQERTTRIVRLRSDGRLQTLASNVDEVWVFVPLDREASANRMERFCRFVIAQGLQPVLVLSKLDLCPNPHGHVSLIFSLGFGAAMHLVSSKTGEGLADLEERLTGGKTALLLGHSGAGKTSLVNALCETRLEVGSVREEDHRGRHTTSARQLLAARMGGYLLDIPGLRELSWESQADLPPDWREWTANCHFRDCNHETNPGCGLVEAVEKQWISKESLEHWRKLNREAAYQVRRSDPVQSANSKARWKTIHKRQKQMEKHRRRQEEEML